jgi:hypothetical protein
MDLISLSLQVINDLLDPTGQNLRVREDAQVNPLQHWLSCWHVLLYNIGALIYLFAYPP